MIMQETADAIRALWQQADSVRYSLKQVVKQMDDEEQEGDDYYATATLFDQLDHIATRLDDADTLAEKIRKSAQ